MPALREHGPYIHPSWLPKLLVGMDMCEFKIWFQAHHDGRTWTKVASDFDLARYNLRHTDLLRRCAQEYIDRGYFVTLENQNEFRIPLAGATVSGRIDLVATRDDELVIIDVKAANPSQAHEIQVMLYMMFLQLMDTWARDKRVTGEVYYGEDDTVAIAAGAADQEFRELVEALIGRLTAKTPPLKVPSASECRFCPIPREYCPEKVEA